MSAQTVRQNVQLTFNRYFTKDAAVKNFISFTKDSLLLYADASAKAKGKKPEFSLSWQQVKALRPCISQMTEKELKSFLMSPNDSLTAANNSINIRHLQHSLKGLRIAIDPGHIGGTYAMASIESRCMTLRMDSVGKPDSIRLEEGNLTFFTARFLKKKLEAQGADVMLTRQDTGLSSLGITFFQWKKKIKNSVYADSLVCVNLLKKSALRLLHLRMSDKELFSRVFTSIDLAERAREINAFMPDITVIIHYNVNETNVGWIHPTGKDFVMAFVGGCVIKKNLETLAGRLNILRLLISPDIENSVRLSADVVKQLSVQLNVPLAHKEDATYLSKRCLATSAEGVFSRNLALTRLIHGTLVYGEALYQDNNKECYLLGNKERVQQVAQAYYDGIVNFLRR